MSRKVSNPPEGVGAVTLHVDAMEVFFVVSVRDAKGRFKRRMRIGAGDGKPIEVPECVFDDEGLAGFVNRNHAEMTKVAKE